MTRFLTLFAVAALLSAGCVSVTEPVGDIDKAEPDKALVGAWKIAKSNGLSAQSDIKELTVDAPDVKGNPKGLMRVYLGSEKEEYGFFVTVVGKHTYVSLILEPVGGKGTPKFGTAGEYAKWTKAEGKRFFVFKYTRDGDTVHLDAGGSDAVPAVMKAEKIEDDGGKHVPNFRTPAGWLAKYLDKNGPDKLFDKTNSLTLTREKK